MNQEPTTPPPEGTPLEIEAVEVSKGTMVDDLGKVSAGAKLRRALLIVAGILFLGTTALAIVFVLGARKMGNEAEGFFGQMVAAAEDGDETPLIDPGESMVTKTFAPTGKTVPGMVYIDSLPDDAQVWVDGESMGRTPLVIGRTFAGKFVQVKVQKTGFFPWNGRVEVVKGGVRTDVTLKPRPGPQ